MAELGKMKMFPMNDLHVNVSVHLFLTVLLSSLSGSCNDTLLRLYSGKAPGLL